MLNCLNAFSSFIPANLSRYFDSFPAYVPFHFFGKNSISVENHRPHFQFLSPIPSFRLSYPLNLDDQDIELIEYIESNSILVVTAELKLKKVQDWNYI